MSGVIAVGIVVCGVSRRYPSTLVVGILVFLRSDITWLCVCNAAFAFRIPR